MAGDALNPAANGVRPGKEALARQALRCLLGKGLGPYQMPREELVVYAVRLEDRVLFMAEQVTDLQKANNREVERRRMAEAARLLGSGLASDLAGVLGPVPFSAAGLGPLTPDEQRRLEGKRRK